MPRTETQSAETDAPVAGVLAPGADPAATAAVLAGELAALAALAASG
jgi:hypothetical protein